jgi:hypothetical protein
MPLPIVAIVAVKVAIEAVKVVNVTKAVKAATGVAKVAATAITALNATKSAKSLKIAETSVEMMKVGGKAKTGAKNLSAKMEFNKLKPNQRWNKLDPKKPDIYKHGSGAFLSGGFTADELQTMVTITYQDHGFNDIISSLPEDIVRLEYPLGSNVTLPDGSEIFNRNAAYKSSKWIAEHEFRGARQVQVSSVISNISRNMTLYPVWERSHPLISLTKEEVDALKNHQRFIKIWLIMVA